MLQGLEFEGGKCMDYHFLSLLCCLWVFDRSGDGVSLINLGCALNFLGVCPSKHDTIFSYNKMLDFFILVYFFVLFLPGIASAYGRVFIWSIHN